MQILAIETSCDETAAAVIQKNGADLEIVSNVVASQIDIHKKFGGVFPEIASRAHVEKIIPVVESALLESEACAFQSKSRRRAARSASRALRIDFHAGEIESGTLKALPSDINVIAVTSGPGLIGSLLVGVNFAKTYAYAKNKPIIGINHLAGHIYSNWAKKPYPRFPAIILIVSGGHTGLVLMKSHHDIKTLGVTLDDAAGEAFDKVAKLLGLGYPGGPAISKAAAKCHPELVEGSPAYAGSRTNREILHYVQDDIKLPRSMLNSGDYNFSFSGLKTAVLYKVKELDLTSQSPNLVRALRFAMAAEFQQAVIDILIGKTIQAAYEYQPKSICLCGGVSANKELREQLKKAVEKLPWKTSYHVPPIELATDNAAMIGVAASYHLDTATKWQNISAEANLKLN